MNQEEEQQLNFIAFAPWRARGHVDAIIVDD